MHRRAVQRRAAAFTLIELLVVIVIVSVLAGLLFSVFGTVQGTGKSAQCVSNMKQVYSALNLYVQDHANTLPQRRYNENDSNGNTFGYTELIISYVDPGNTPKNSTLARKIYTCPSQSKGNYPSEPGYGMNWFYDNTNLGLISQPATTIALAETQGTSGTGSRRANRDNNGSGDIGRLDDKRHRGKANYVFFDGHLASLTYQETRQVITPSDEDPPPDMWGKDYDKHTEPAPTPPYGS